MSDSEEEIIIKKKVKVVKDDENDERKKSIAKITNILSQVYELWKDLSKDLSEKDKDVLRQLSKNMAGNAMSEMSEMSEMI
jgi:hypothetical protein